MSCNILFKEIPPLPTEDIFQILEFKPDLIILHSSKQINDCGRYTYICFDSFATFIAKGNHYLWQNKKINISNPFNFIQEKINEYTLNKNPNLPLLQGGAVGYFGYECNHYLENLAKLPDPIQLPDIYLNFYSNIIAIDHLEKKQWILCTGFPFKGEERIAQAKKNIQKIKNLLKIKPKQNIKMPKKFVHSIESNFTSQTYIEAVQKTKDYILNGDIFEANISQQFRATLINGSDPLTLYLKLMKINPAPFSAFIKIPNQGYILSASPERFIKLENGNIETCPIKGTRKRSKNKSEDERLANELLKSDKDQAENIMIVDLMRNDLSKVSKLNSIQVKELCALQSFETVHHLVSKICAQIKPDKKPLDMIQAAFPAGSITGAPKIRTMQIISELERTTRGPYCGNIGYISFSGDMDTSVVIRSFFINQQEIFFSAGGAIILDSDPYEEYNESISKAQALIQALTK